jgi:hypothetical protein
VADTPKIQIDSDWKAEAQKEKERLAKIEAEKAATGKGGAAGELPPADFRTIVSMLAQQAIMGLGVMADRKTGGVIVDLEGSRFAIDLLDVLEQKTKGNLTADETEELKQILGDLRTRFVQIATVVSKQMMNPPAGGAATGGAAADVAQPAGNGSKAATAPAASTKPSPIITE